MHALETALVSCPYCGESIELVIDPSVSFQEYIEDCSVCCRPIVLTLRVDDGGDISVIPRHEDDC